MRKIQFFYATMMVLLAVAVEGAAQTTTKVIDNGPDAGKKVIAVLGDGYTQAEQDLYNTHVDNLLINGAFGNDFFREHHNAFNVYRVNLVSFMSGVSQKRYNENGTSNDPSDDTLTSITASATALQYFFSGSWAHGWMEASSQTERLLQNALRATVPNADYVLIILNETGYGGHASGGRAVVTRGSGWQVLAHEFGHSIGGLWDEYSVGRGAYTGSYVNNRNCSTEKNLSKLFWGRFISPATLQDNVDPGRPNVAGGSVRGFPFLGQPGPDPNRTVGLFEGCSYADTGIYRPVDTCRMRSSSQNFCPVCQTIMRKSFYPYLNHNFDRSYVGDFNGDGRSDLLVHNGNDVAIYQSSPDSTFGFKLDLAWIANNAIPPAPGGSCVWAPASGDKYYVADLNNDGKDDVYVFNGTNRSQPRLGLLKSNGAGLETVIYYDFSVGGWMMKPDDELLVGDFNDDGKDDLYVFNGTSWPQPYLGMAKSTGSALSFVVRYDGAIAPWLMAKGDKYYVGDFNDDGKDDLYVFNGTSWSNKYLGMLKSTGNGLFGVNLYANDLPSGWQMSPHDEHYVGDIDGDGKDDLYVFNGQDWTYAYLEMTKSTGTSLSFVKRYTNQPGPATWGIPGWSLAKGDRFYVGNFGFDRRSDLIVYNTSNWYSKYLGRLVSSGTELSGNWSRYGVGAWDLQATNQLLVGSYANVGVKPDVFINNLEWLGMLRGDSSGFSMDRVYYHWIHTPLYDSKPWSDSLP